MAEKSFTVNVLLNGPGKVGVKFLELFWKKQRLVRELTSAKPRLVVVKTRDALFYKPDGFNPEDLGCFISSGGEVIWTGTLREKLGPFAFYHGNLKQGRDVYDCVLNEVSSRGPSILIEATPTNLKDGEPGLSHVRSALSHGVSVVCLAKGPLVLAYGELLNLAKTNRVSLRYSGCVAAALPTVDTAVWAMAGSEIYEVEGVLNGTSNFVLNEMAKGKSFEEALETARDMGVAERDATLDVEGLDSAAKLVIIADTIWDQTFELSSVKVQGITGLSLREVQEAWRKGNPIRLMARARYCSLDQGGQFELEVKPEEVAPGHPFALLDGTKKGITFYSREMGQVTVLGGASDVLGAAASAFKDMIHVIQDLRYAHGG